MQPKPISEGLRPLVLNCRVFIAYLVTLRSDTVTAPRESLWLRHNQKIRTTLETLSSKSTKSTLNPCLQTRANHASVKWQTIGIRSAVQCPLGVAGSTGRRNTGIKSLCWGFKLQGLTWSFVELTSHFVQIGLRMHRQVGAFRKVLSQQTIGVLIRAALPRALRVAEVDIDVGRQGKSSMIRKLLAPSQVSDLYSSVGSFFACLMSAD